MKSDKFCCYQARNTLMRLKRLPNNIQITYFECKLLGCADLCMKRTNSRTDRIYFEMLYVKKKRIAHMLRICYCLKDSRFVYKHI